MTKSRTFADVTTTGIEVPFQNFMPLAIFRDELGEDALGTHDRDVAKLMDVYVC